jgi:hypothetical protein
MLWLIVGLLFSMAFLFSYAAAGPNGSEDVAMGLWWKMEAAFALAILLAVGKPVPFNLGEDSDRSLLSVTAPIVLAQALMMLTGQALRILFATRMPFYAAALLSCGVTLVIWTIAFVHVSRIVFRVSLPPPRRQVIVMRPPPPASPPISPQHPSGLHIMADACIARVETPTGSVSSTASVSSVSTPHSPLYQHPPVPPSPAPLLYPQLPTLSYHSTDQ